MHATIDPGGRIVIPKPLRQRLGLGPGTTVEITERDGILEIEPANLEVDLVEGPHGVVAVTDRALPPLDAQTVRETLENLRR